MITHIFLDVDNTILDFNKAEAIALEKTLSALSVPHSPEVRRYSQLNLAQWKLLEQEAYKGTGKGAPLPASL